MTARTPDVASWTGAAAVAVAVVTAIEFGIHEIAVGGRPPLDQGAALVAFEDRTQAGTLGMILTDTVLMAVILVFLSGFRQIVVQSRADLRWVADVMVSAGIAYVGVTLVGDGLEGAAALDTTVGGGDATVIQALTVADALFFGSIGCLLTALVSLASGALILRSEVLPRWTGRLALVLAVPNLVLVGTAFGGTAGGSFKSAGGWGSVALGTVPWLIWIVCVGVVLVRDREHHRSAAESLRAAGRIAA